MSAPASRPLALPARLPGLPAGWKWVRLMDMCSGVFDCPHSTPELAETGPLLARTQDVRTGVFRFDQAAHVSEDTYRARTRRAEPKHGDLLFSREGTYFGVAAEVRDGIRVCLGQRMVLLRPDHCNVDFRFLRLWLNSAALATHMEGLHDGSVAQRLNVSTIRGLPVPVPPLAEQQAISEILGALDDKAEVNREVNKILDDLAMTLFKSWFVDFDPVVAKRDGRTPVGLPAEAIDLFPSHFEEAKLGSTPQGWRLSSIGAEVTVVGGSTPSTSEPGFWNGDVCWLTPRDLSRLDDPVVLDTERHITQEGLEQISSGLLPVGTVLLSSRAPIGYIAVAEVPVAINQGFIAMKCDKQLSSHFAVNWVRENLDEVLSRAGGTTFAEISKAAFRPIPVVVPPPEVLQVFDAIVAPLHAMRVANVRESSTLAALRDTLLGPLLSGELTIKSAEEAVGAAL